MTVNNTLQDRQTKYGDYADVATMTSELMSIVKFAPNKDKLHTVHEQALHMIFVKISRMLCGDCMNEDNAHDIAGYATLLEEYIRGRNERIQNRK